MIVSMLNSTPNVTLYKYEDEFNTEQVDPNIKYKLYIIVPIIWSFIFLVAFLGNGLIIYIILKRRLYKNSCTNCYIINVAVADLCFSLMCVPVTMSAYVYEQWLFGDFLCHLQNLFMFSSLQAACLTLTAMTFDRYLAVLFPLKSIEYRTTKMALLINVVIWIASFTLNSPYYIYYNEEVYNSSVASKTNPDQYDIMVLKYCVAKFPSIKFEIILTLYTVLISYCLPLIVIIVCYLQMIVYIIHGQSSEQKLLKQSKNFASAHKTVVNRKENSVKSEPKVSDNRTASTGSNEPALSDFKSEKMYEDTDQEGESLFDEEDVEANNKNAKRVKNRDHISSTSTGFKYKKKFKVVTKSSTDETGNQSSPTNRASFAEASSSGDASGGGGGHRVNEGRKKLNIKCFLTHKSYARKVNKTRSESRTESLNLSNSNTHTNYVSSNNARANNVVRKQKLKILVLIALVSIIFALTWLPAHIIRIWKVVFYTSFPYNDAMYIIKVISHTLTYTNSVLNPFLYVFIGAKFRKHIYAEFNQIFCRKRAGVVGGHLSGGSTRRSTNPGILTTVNRNNNQINNQETRRVRANNNYEVSHI